MADKERVNKWCCWEEAYPEASGDEKKVMSHVIILPSKAALGDGHKYLSLGGCTEEERKTWIPKIIDIGNAESKNVETMQSALLRIISLLEEDAFENWEVALAEAKEALMSTARHYRRGNTLKG